MSSANDFIKAVQKGDVSAVRKGISNGVDPNLVDAYALTGLMSAARKGHLAVFEELVTAGADLAALDRTGRTFLHHCVLFRRNEFLRAVLSQPGIPLQQQDMHGFTALDVAVADANENAAKILRGAGCPSGLSQA